jgi:predicted MPP superfamily phosphohydrolase
MLIVSILVTDLGGLALGAWLLWGTAERRGAGWKAAAIALGALGLLLGLATLALGLAAGSGFLVLRLWCHALFCVLVPLGVARGVQRRGAVGWTLVALGLLAEGAFVWARRVEPYRLEVTRHRIDSARLPHAPARDGPLRIAVLADLQTDDVGAFEARVFAALDAERADLVLIPGDLLQLHAAGSPESARRERAELVALFARLEHPPRLGFLMVRGDCEPRGAGFAEAGIRMLADERVVFPEERVQVIGLALASSRRPLAPELADAARAFDGLTLVLGHAPEFILPAAELDVPLVLLAGHTHGGQVVLPFLGPPLTLARVPRWLARGGLHRIGESFACVSRGLGMERGLAPRIRFLCRPELVVIELGGTRDESGRRP